MGPFEKNKTKQKQEEFPHFNRTLAFSVSLGNYPFCAVLLALTAFRQAPESKCSKIWTGLLWGEVISLLLDEDSLLSEALNYAS